MGSSLGLFLTKYHDLAYNLSCCTLSDPSQMASRSVRRQLGHSLLSSFKYRFNIDRRNSPLRPTQGYTFVSTTQLGGLAPDSRSSRVLLQLNYCCILKKLDLDRGKCGFRVSFSPSF